MSKNLSLINGVNQSIIATFSFPVINSGTSIIDSVSIGGQTLDENILAILHNMDINASSGPVLIDYNDAIITVIAFGGPYAYVQFGFDMDTNGKLVKELVDWLNGASDHRCSGDKAKQTLDIMMSIYQSARINEKVHFPVEEDTYPLDLMFEEGKIPLKKSERY